MVTALEEHYDGEGRICSALEFVVDTGCGRTGGVETFH